MRKKRYTICAMKVEIGVQDGGGEERWEKITFAPQSTNLTLIILLLAYKFYHIIMSRTVDYGQRTLKN